jgi:hypothetical protein
MFELVVGSVLVEELHKLVVDLLLDEVFVDDVKLVVLLVDCVLDELLELFVDPLLDVELLKLPVDSLLDEPLVDSVLVDSLVDKLGEVLEVVVVVNAAKSKSRLDAPPDARIVLYV